MLYYRVTLRVVYPLKSMHRFIKDEVATIGNYRVYSKVLYYRVPYKNTKIR